MPWCFPSFCWHIQHVVQHHVYTNDDDDVDLYHFLPVCRTTKNMPWEKVFRLQWLTIFVILPTTVGHLLFIVPIDLLCRTVCPITGKKRYQECENVEDLVNRNFMSIFLEWVACFSWFLANVYSSGLLTGCHRLFTSYGVASIMFIVFTQGAHLQDQCMLGKDDPSWAKRQAATSVNFSPASRFWGLMSGGLNVQSIHHVAPIVGSNHLRDIFPEFKKVCEKHDVPLHEASDVLDFSRGFVRWITELAKKD